MKRVALVTVGGYLVVAVAKKVAEAAGAMTCDCADDCWCRRPGFSLFRWVFPWRHRSARTSEDKALLRGEA